MGRFLPGPWDRFQPGAGMTYRAQDPTFRPPVLPATEPQGGRCRHLLSSVWAGREWQGWEQRFGLRWKWRFALRLRSDVGYYLVERLTGTEPDENYVHRFPAGFNFTPHLPGEVRTILAERLSHEAPESLRTSDGWLMVSDPIMGPHVLPLWWQRYGDWLWRMADAFEGALPSPPAADPAPVDAGPTHAQRNVWTAAGTAPQTAPHTWPAPSFDRPAGMQDPPRRSRS